MKWNDKTASDRVIVVYDAVMMQQNIFQGEMHITKCCLSQQVGGGGGRRSSARETVLTCKIYICLITSRDILPVKVYCKTNLNDGGSREPMDL